MTRDTLIGVAGGLALVLLAGAFITVAAEYARNESWRCSMRPEIRCTLKPGLSPMPPVGRRVDGCSGPFSHGRPCWSSCDAGRGAATAFVKSGGAGHG